MMTKPPGFASSSSLPMAEEDEESIDESLDEILLEANERPLDSSSSSLETTPEPAHLSSLLDAMSPGPSSLPGMSRPAASPVSDVTVLMPRPTFADEVKEEETKVEPYETAIHAAASRDDRLGLSSQASEQRDRALRKSSTSPRLLARRSPDDLEFEDPEGGDSLLGGASARAAAALDDDIDTSERTPADIPIAEDESQPSAPSYLGGSGSGGFQSRLPPPLRTSPPPGRPDIYPGRRIPTPSSDFMPAPTGGGFGSGAHYPSIAIPAPSANEISARTRTSLTDGRVRLPIGGLAGFLVTAFAGGLLVGALIWRGHAPTPPVETAVVSHPVPRAPAEPTQGIVVKPVPPPAAPGASSASATAANTGTNTNPSGGGSTIPTLAAETPSTDATALAAAAAAEAIAKAKKKESASRPKKPVIADDDAAAASAASDSPPPAPTPKPSKGKGKKAAAVWQDPFAQ